MYVKRYDTTERHLLIVATQLSCLVKNNVIKRVNSIQGVSKLYRQTLQVSR